MMASEAKSQKYDGSAILKNLKHDFDMNVQFQLRKLGIDLVTMSDRMGELLWILYLRQSCRE